MARFYGGASAQQDRPFNRRVKPATTQEQLESAERRLAELEGQYIDGHHRGFREWSILAGDIQRQKAIVARLREQAKKEAL